MSVQMFDKRGGLGQAATNKGFGDAREMVLRTAGYVELKRFFEKGYTKNPKKAAEEAMEIAHKCKDDNVGNSLSNISGLLAAAEGFAVVE